MASHFTPAAARLAAVSQWADVDGWEYELTRPEWPMGVRTFLREACQPGGVGTVVDLGAGTGKLTSHVAAVGATVIAVDPAAELLAVLVERVPSARPIVSRAEETGLPDASVDGVVAGNAFHWFHPDAAATEAFRILRPGGLLAVFWNRPEWPAWFAELRQLLAPYRNPVADSAEARAESGSWKAGLERRFGQLDSAVVGARRQTWSPEGFASFLRTTGYIAALDSEAQEQVSRVLSEYVRTLPKCIVVPHKAEAAWTHKSA